MDRGESPGAPPRILIVHTSGRIGDTLLVTPAIKAIRQRYAESTITVFANKNTLPCLRHNPDIDVLKAFHRRTTPLFGLLGPKQYAMAFVFCGIGDNKTAQISYARRTARQVCAFRTGTSHDDNVAALPGTSYNPARGPCGRARERGTK